NIHDIIHNSIHQGLADISAQMKAQETAGKEGYICKRCHKPAPLGVGSSATTPVSPTPTQKPAPAAHADTPKKSNPHPPKGHHNGTRYRNVHRQRRTKSSHRHHVRPTLLPDTLQ